MYAIDARQEITMLGDRESGYGEGESQGDYEGDETETNDHDATQRDEREVAIKREKLMNR